MSGVSDRYLGALERQMSGLATKKRRGRAAGPPPFPGTMLDALDAAGMTGPTWDPWRTFWKVVDRLPLTDDDLTLYRACTGRDTPPTTPVRECALIIGRRGGKTRNSALRAMYRACRTDYSTMLAPGERAVVPLIAADRKQALQALSYVKGLARLDAFAPYVVRVLKESVELRGVVVEVHTASYRSTRGYTIVDVLADEVAFWRSEDGANPDSEVLNALRPGMATIPGALLLMASTPYSRRGELYRTWERHYGQVGTDTLAWVAPTLTMNPGLSKEIIDRAYEDDPASAAAEYGAEWRRDIEAFLPMENVVAVTVPGRYELPPLPGVRYHAFVDPAGGSGSDSYTLAIAHREGDRAVLDCVRERRPPFSPEAVTREVAAVLHLYRVRRVTGDHYAGEFPRELLARRGIEYRAAARPKSDLYLALLPLVNSGRVVLLEHGKLKAQLVGLERRTSRSGKDSVDHAPGSHDDVANAVAGALVHLVGPGSRRLVAAARGAIM